MPAEHILIALGSNIDAEAHLRKAAGKLRAHAPDIRFSRVYRSAPLLRTDQEDFLNAVGAWKSEEPPEEIAMVLQEIERSLGKAPPFRYGPRTIDLDFLLYGNQSIALSASPYPFTIPHPRMHERRFVLEPLCELMDARLKHPVLGESWETLLQKTRNQRCAVTAITL